ncbi:hypothetical protein ACIVBQ_002731 [Tenacibaculum discolor]
MILIKEFEYEHNNIESNSNQKGISYKTQIQEEIKRPLIKFFNSQGKIIDITDWKNFNIHESYLKEPFFSKDELKFLAEMYSFQLIKEKNYKKKEVLVSTNKQKNVLYKSAAKIILIEDSTKEYLVIEFNRWQYDYQPRSAGEDQLGEDITYIHGIWEQPLLTDEIIEKIKKS